MTTKKKDEPSVDPGISADSDEARAASAANALTNASAGDVNANMPIGDQVPPPPPDESSATA